MCVQFNKWYAARKEEGILATTHLAATVEKFRTELASDKPKKAVTEELDASLTWKP